jgi:hypothetical protein
MFPRLGTNWIFISQKTTFFIVTAMETSNLKCNMVLLLPVTFPKSTSIYDLLVSAYKNRKLISILRIASSGMLRRVALVRTAVSKELNASFIRVTRIGALGTMLAVTCSVRRLLVTASVVRSSPILVTLMKGGTKFIRKVGSYKSHTA